MAKIAAMPSMAVVDSLRGKLDFYKWCGLTIVRKWPKSPGRSRNPNVVAAQGPFIYINKIARFLPDTIHEAYQVLAQDSAFSWKDWLNRLYINASIRDHLIPPEE